MLMVLHYLTEQRYELWEAIILEDINAGIRILQYVTQQYSGTTMPPELIPKERKDQ